MLWSDRERHEESPVAAECRSTPHHRRQTSWPYYVGAVSAALASCSAASGVQTRLSGAPGIVRSNAYVPGWWYPSRLRRQPFGLPLITCVRCHVGTTASETEALALLVREFGTVCHVACEHFTSATNILKHHWRHICLTRPRRFVTFYISALEILLLTYLLKPFGKRFCLTWRSTVVSSSDFLVTMTVV